MDTQITVADARARLYREVDAANINSPVFVSALNEAIERLTNSGLWKSSIEYVRIPASTKKFFTLPRQYASALSLRYRGLPQMMFTQFYPFSVSGAGQRDDADDWKYFNSVMVDLGDGFVTQDDIVTPGPLRVAIDNATDAGKAIRLFGTDVNDRPIYDSMGRAGIEVLTVNPVVTTTQIFKTVTGIQAPAMVRPWLLSVVNNSIVTQLGVYQPGETRPMYKRYGIGTRDDVIECLAARRYIPVVNESDWVFPGNISALRYALQMLAFEAAGQQAEAQGAWQGALGFLNDEARYARGGAQPSVNIISINAGGVQIGAQYGYTLQNRT